MSHAHVPPDRLVAVTVPKKIAPLMRRAKMTKGQFRAARASRWACASGIGGVEVGRSFTRRRGAVLAQSNDTDTAATITTVSSASAHLGGESQLVINVHAAITATTTPTVFH